MVNAWSLLYDELYEDGGMTKEKYNYDDKGPGVVFEHPSPKRSNNESTGSDTITFGDIGDTTISGGAGSDVLEIHGAGDYYPGKYDWGEDGLNMTGSAGSDTISFSMNVAAGPVEQVAGGMADDTINLNSVEAFRGSSKVAGSRVPGGMGEDHISFSGGFDTTAQDFPQYYSDIHGMVAGVDPFAPDLSHRKPAPNLKSTVSKKYQEDVGIKDLKDYVSSTYQGHYTNDSSDVQTLDLIHSVGDAESFCRSNALKYLSRYDKKGQAKRDILKAMHYCLLLYYFSGNTNNETSARGYETF